MARYTAQVWVTGDHPYDAEINAANVFLGKHGRTSPDFEGADTVM